MNMYDDLKVVLTLEYNDYPLCELLKDSANNQLYFTFITGNGIVDPVHYLVLPISFLKLQDYIKNDAVVKDMFIYKDVFISNENGDLREIYISKEEAEDRFTGLANLVWLFSFGGEEKQTKEYALYCLEEIKKKFNDLEYNKELIDTYC